MIIDDKFITFKLVTYKSTGQVFYGFYNTIIYTKEKNINGMIDIIVWYYCNSQFIVFIHLSYKLGARAATHIGT